jgi:hypothetical protein
MQEGRKLVVRSAGKESKKKTEKEKLAPILSDTLTSKTHLLIVAVTYIKCLDNKDFHRLQKTVWYV